MKHRAIFYICLAVLILFTFSCNKDNDKDDDDNTSEDDDTSGCAEKDIYEDPCEYIIDAHCVPFEEFPFEIVKDCKDYIALLLDSDDSCKRDVGECLNTILVTSTNCVVTRPAGCAEAESLWLECLGGLDSDICQ